MLPQLNETVWWRFRYAGVSIAFPQLDLHLDPVVTESVQRLPRAG
jgi:small-conductance mechanosensitive channel